MKKKQLKKAFILLLLVFFKLTAVNAEMERDNLNYPNNINRESQTINCEWGSDFLTPTVDFKNLDSSSLGARIFSQEIPNPVSYMQRRCLEVAQILYRKSSEAPKFRKLTFELRAKNSNGESFVAYKWGNDGVDIGIAVSTEHLAKIYRDSGNNAQVIKDEIDGILYHEVTHGYNNSPSGAGSYDGQSEFWAYTEGIADAVRIHAGYHQTRNPDISGRKWLGGYTTTGFFFHYVSQKNDKNFVYKLNKSAKTINPWSFDKAFVSITGKSVQTVWNEYASFVNGNGDLDYDGNYPWVLDCSDDNGGGDLPVASFSVDKRTVKENERVSFRSTSTRASQYSWSFDGGSPSNSTEANPVVTYSRAGVYDVSLNISNSEGSDTEVKNRYITVTGATVPPPGGSDDLTQPGGDISDSNNDSPTNEGIANLIDDNTGTKYLTFSASTTVNYNFSKGYVISGYSLTSANDAAERDPASWILEGSNDGSNWIAIDTKSNNSFSGREEKKSFTVSGTSGYSKIRFRFTNTSGGVFQLAELEVFGKEGGTTPPSGDSDDLTEPGGNVSDSNNDSPSNEGVANLVDDNTETKYLTFNASTTVNYNFSKGYVISGYSLTSANDEAERDPASWILEGSNDGSNWVAIDTKSNNSFSSRKEKKSFTVSGTLGYSKIRFRFTNTSGAIFQLAELELFGKEGGTTPPSGDSDDLTEPRGNILDSNNDSPTNEGVANLVDNNTGTKYLTFSASTTVNYNFVKGYVISGYSLTSANDAAERDPASWVLEGSNDGSNWTALDRRNNNSFSGRKEKKVFTFNNTTSFSRIRFTFNNTSGNIFQLAELEVFGKGGGTPPPPPSGCEWGNDFLTPRVDFQNTDSSSLGSRIFNQEISNPVSYMQRRCLEVAQILYRKSSEAPKFRKLTFELRKKNTRGESFVAYKYGTDGVEIGIAVSTEHLAKIYRDSGNNAQVIKDEIDGILYHEVTHGYNNSPSGAGSYDGQSEFWAYTEGIADAVRIHAGYHQTRNPDISGKKWLGGYTTTGFFFHYVSQKVDKNFVYKLNKSAKTINPWSFDKAFRFITGKSVQTVWNEYVNFVNGSGNLDYDGNYPWSLDCSENEVAVNKMNVDEFIKVKDNVRFYPNPIEGEINIIYNKEKVTTVNIRSLQGNVVFSKERVSFSKGQVINMQLNLPSGIYLLEIDGNIEKLIVKSYR
ncbi:basic secretory protein-like protein [Tenacibaculum ovolyticum]|uniref:basic secretory protein-like protein n=1 Tax=Tenacibaculum ovolyticum TaxID=104270 RepID=UPI0007ED4FAA|nr:basic secretory protein-like protein [Tenacibaculum ovolyticum]